MTKKSAVARQLFGKAAKAAASPKTTAKSTAAAARKKRQPKPLPKSQKKSTAKADASSPASSTRSTPPPATTTKATRKQRDKFASPAMAAKQASRQRLVSEKASWPQLTLEDAAAALVPNATGLSEIQKSYAKLNTSPMQGLVQVTRDVIAAIKDPRAFYVTAFLMKDERFAWEHVTPEEVISQKGDPTTFFSVRPRKGKARFDTIPERASWPVAEHQLFYRALG